MRRYAMLLIVLLTSSILSFAQVIVMASAGELVSISETQVVLHFHDEDHVFMIDNNTKLSGRDGKKISISDFTKGDNIQVTCEIDSKVAMEVRKGLIKKRMGF